MRIAPLRRVEVVCAEVRHAGEHDPRALMREHDVLVHQHAHAEALELGGPGGLARVILVIAGDEERAVPRVKSRERRGVARQVAHRAIDEIARQRDDIGLERDSLRRRSHRHSRA